jgi:hypothetical protein
MPQDAQPRPVPSMIRHRPAIALDRARRPQRGDAHRRSHPRHRGGQNRPEHLLRLRHPAQRSDQDRVSQTRCPAGERKIAWNKVGPQGPVGLKGPSGPPGPPGVVTGLRGGF